ncbi:esterase [Biostraticola tofi]|uniref:Peptidase S9 prolyl oligopeptidase catalytic domain-containing protein n=1 Tax=Biostraticola tofi TaxID=466109 RepID=A0A4R3Z518_9GAMM|nr:esterase [Biostraticola tofi]TCV99008.1 hypothetical protein EDC52_102336 [Biostraticola tofi]
MVEMHQESVDGIDVIHAVPAGAYNQPLPTLFFYHGYTSSKEVYSYFGYALAKAGFRVILPDALMHGARFDGNEAYRFNHFWDILRNNIDEVPGLYHFYRQKGLIEEDRVGICGASMGGMTALGAMARYSWLKATACFMGSGGYLSLSSRLFPQEAQDGDNASAPGWAPLAEYDVYHRLDRLAGRPLLLWHGEADPLVPPEESAELYQALRNTEGHHQVTYLTEAGIGHKITVSALAAGCEFFKHHL